MAYITRAAAKNGAKSRGYAHFRTIFDSNINQWTVREVNPPKPLDFSWADGKDFIAWREVDFFTGLRPVLIVSITKEEVALENIPEHFIVEPQTPSLWAHNEPESAIRKTRTTEGAERERSAVESPTKLVWKIASEMVGKTRAEVIAACVAAGVHPATASTQFSKWRKAQG